jgi:hypothetical protein
MSKICLSEPQYKGHNRDMRPVSLEPVCPEVKKKIIPKSDQWPNYRTH